MSKSVNVQFSVSYDTIRQMYCIVTGKALSDEEISEIIEQDLIVIDTENLGNARKETEQMLGALVLSQAFDKVMIPKKSRFQERLDEVKKQRVL